MSLTEDEKYAVIHYLGYSSRTITAGTRDYNSVIASNLTNLSPQGESYIRSTLADLEALKANLAATRKRMLVRKVGDIELNSDEWSLLQKEYSRVLNELSRATDIALLSGRSAMIRMVV
jgi:hypothetical protein